MNDKERDKWFEESFKTIFQGKAVIPNTSQTKEEMDKYYRLDKPKSLNYK